MSMIPRCAICADAIDAYGRDGTLCARCRQGCPQCGKSPAYCQHPLTDVSVTDLGDGRFRLNDREAA